MVIYITVKCHLRLHSDVNCVHRFSLGCMFWQLWVWIQICVVLFVSTICRRVAVNSFISAVRCPAADLQLPPKKICTLFLKRSTNVVRYYRVSRQWSWITASSITRLNFTFISLTLQCCGRWRELPFFIFNLEKCFAAISHFYVSVLAPDQCVSWRWI